MSRTTKWEHRTDSWHENHRFERKARPAGRDSKPFNNDLQEAGMDRDRFNDSYDPDQFEDTRPTLAELQAEARERTKDRQDEWTPADPDEEGPF